MKFFSRKSTVFAFVAGILSIGAWIFEMIASSYEYEEYKKYGR